MTRKPLYYVSEEKKIYHIGFWNSSRNELLESLSPSLEGVTADSLFRETDTAVYAFCCSLPEDVVNLWFSQILKEPILVQSHGSAVAAESEKRPKVHKIKKVEPGRTGGFLEIRRPPKKRVRSIEELHTRSPSPVSIEVPRTARRKRKKDIDTLREEIKGQRQWEPFVPTCSQCVFWESHILPFSQVHTGQCKVTGNLVEGERKACSEFQK
ncbi:MAG: hypothetical protein HXS40_04315 [Theionarchaea archaeon]|nr:hypothetical protein [Theionarchaea archaeon]